MIRNTTIAFRMMTMRSLRNIPANFSMIGSALSQNIQLFQPNLLFQGKSMTTGCLYMFARQNRAAKREVSDNSSNSTNVQTEQFINTEENHGEKQQIQQFRFSSETFNKMLEALSSEENGASVKELIRESDLKEQLTNGAVPEDDQSLLLCLQVLDLCGIREENLRKVLLTYVLERPLALKENNLYTGTVLSYFVRRHGRKQYTLELEEFFISRIPEMNEEQLRDLTEVYVFNNFGSADFFKAIQGRLLQIVAGSRVSAEHIHILLKHYLKDFTKANFFIPEMEQLLISLIQDKLPGADDNSIAIYFETTTLEYVPDILYFFALKYQETEKMHENLLELLKQQHIKRRNLPKEVLKPLGLLLEVRKLADLTQMNLNRKGSQTDTETIDDFFLPALRLKQSILRESTSQSEIAVFIRKCIKQIHLKENYSIDIFNVDFYAEINSKKLVIEVNGRFHYFHKRRSGMYEIKRRCLEQLGCTVVEIYEYDWKKYETEEQKNRFIQTLLAPYVNSVVASKDK